MSQVLNFKEIDPPPVNARILFGVQQPRQPRHQPRQTARVSVKDSDDAIGFFGTGLKYAIACTLRLGGDLTIFSDGQRFNVGGEKLTLGDDEFTRVTLNSEPLGLTSELGKQWDAWMVVRELYSNALDEQGGTSLQVQGLDDLQQESAGRTIITLRGEEFLRVWDNRGSYFISGDEVPVHRSDYADAYAHRCGSGSVFYRGIRVYDSQKPTLFRYNVREKIEVTEDRTARYVWQITETVERSIITSNDPSYITRALTGAKRASRATSASVTAHRQACR